MCAQVDNAVSCDVTQEVNSTTVDVDCSVTSLLLSAHSQVVNSNKLIAVLYFMKKSLLIQWQLPPLFNPCSKVTPSPSTLIT